MESSLIGAILVVLLIVIIFAVWKYGVPGHTEGIVSYATSFPLPGRGHQGRHVIPYGDERLSTAGKREGMEVNPEALSLGLDPQRMSVYKALSHQYSTADVDPIVTGQLYDYSDQVRNAYAQRSSHGDGLEEYSSSGGPGDVGVDIGPIGLAEYGGKEIGFDDGIPPEWRMPSTPVQWYAPKQRDFYGPEGPTAYTEGLYTLAEPDHDPKM